MKHKVSNELFHSYIMSSLKVCLDLGAWKWMSPAAWRNAELIKFVIYLNTFKTAEALANSKPSLNTIVWYGYRQKHQHKSIAAPVDLFNGKKAAMKPLSLRQNRFKKIDTISVSIFSTSWILFEIPVVFENGKIALLVVDDGQFSKSARIKGNDQ